jgi:hypothetical protein
MAAGIHRKDDMDKPYQVIKTFVAHVGEVPFLLPVGTLLHWWDERGFYNSEAVNNVCVPVTRWAVETWSDYFMQVVEDDGLEGV